MATPQGQPPITTATVSTMAKASRRVIVMSLPRRPSPSCTAWQGDAGQAIAGDASKNSFGIHRVLERHVWASRPWFARPCLDSSSPDRGAHRLCYASCCAKTMGKRAVTVLGLPYHPPPHTGERHGALEHPELSRGMEPELNGQSNLASLSRRLCSWLKLVYIYMSMPRCGSAISKRLARQRRGHAPLLSQRLRATNCYKLSESC